MRKFGDELQRQLDENNMKVKKGVMQDATFITSDPGHSPADKPRGPEAKTRRNKEGTWAKKGGKNHTLATNYTLKPILITV